MSNKFSNTVEKVNRLLGKAKESAETVQILYEKGDMQEAYDECFRLERLSEKIVLNTRSLPVHTGNPRAERQVSSIIKEEVPVEIGYTKEGWFSLRRVSVRCHLQLHIHRRPDEAGPVPCRTG